MVLQPNVQTPLSEYGISMFSQPWLGDNNRICLVEESENQRRLEILGSCFS